MVLFGQTVINLVSLEVDVIDRGASLTLGPNQYVDVLMSNKQNQGFGEQNGTNGTADHTVIILSDEDTNDSSAVKTSAGD
ncbi:hypothetical protein [Peribacillus kribbensis]|uniref:hypothetical protein n=1 Tax=Peribacillus kribbensis TaxID=356658 RepID=UPI00055213B1|nr:hypothetical protein [Peribacillus kribbensis]